MTSTISTTTETPRRRMTRPPSHPGEVLRHLHMEPLGLTITALAERLGVSRKHLSAILNQRAGVTPDMALRLARAFGTTPEVWLNLQQRYDLWRAEAAPTGWQAVPAITPAQDDGQTRV